MKRHYTQADKDFRARVLKRDKYKCQMCGYKVRRFLQVHHIVRYADNTALRYDDDNGITLCTRCHYKVRNQEHLYIELFRKLRKGNG